MSQALRDGQGKPAQFAAVGLEKLGQHFWRHAGARVGHRHAQGLGFVRRSVQSHAAGIGAGDGVGQQLAQHIGGALRVTTGQADECVVDRHPQRQALGFGLRTQLRGDAGNYIAQVEGLDRKSVV